MSPLEKVSSIGSGLVAKHKGSFLILADKLFISKKLIAFQCALKGQRAFSPF